MNDEFSPEHLDEPVERDECASVPYAVGQTEADDDTVAASFDISGHREFYATADDLRAVADHIDRVAGRETCETDPRERGEGWDDEDIIMTNRSDVTALVAADSLEKVMDDRAESVLLSIEYLQEALDVATNLQDGDGKTELWVSVQRDRPLVMTPNDNDTNLAASVAPRVLNDDADAKSPTEEL